jgi:hypothetical protein
LKINIQRKGDGQVSEANEAMYQLRTDVRDYVQQGGWDALSFSMLAYPNYADVPGRAIQRIIADEITKLREARK